MRTYDVEVPATKRVVFPDRCVVCEVPRPDGHIKLSILGAESPSFKTFVVDRALGADLDLGSYGGNTTNEVAGIPACGKCSSGLKWYHRMLKFGYYTAWIPGIAPLLFLHTPMVFNIVFLIICACMPGILTLIFPPSFGASFYAHKANFEFKSKTIADEFMELNTDAKLKGVKDAEMPVAA